LSFSEPELLLAFDSYITVTKSLIYTKIQPCIRHNDFIDKIANKIDLYKYLGLFEMADISGVICLPDKAYFKETAEFTIESLWNFLIKKLNFDKDKLYIKYFSGGNIKDVTENKYNINKEISPDKLGTKKWGELGLNEKNFIPDKTRDTFLALYLGRPTTWGYRQEVLYEFHGELLDIATVIYNVWEPIMRGDEVIDIKDWDSIGCVSAIGVERILMVKNDFGCLVECSHIYPLQCLIIKDAQNKNQDEAQIATEAIRIIHRIITDCGSYENLSGKRRQKIRKYFFYLKDSLNKLKIQITEKNILKYLKLNAELQKHYPELKQGIPNTMSRFVEYVKVYEKLFKNQEVNNVS